MISSSDILFGFACSTNELARMDMCSAGPAYVFNSFVQMEHAATVCCICPTRTFVNMQPHTLIVSISPGNNHENTY